MRFLYIGPFSHHTGSHIPTSGYGTRRSGLWGGGGGGGGGGEAEDLAGKAVKQWKQRRRKKEQKSQGWNGEERGTSGPYYYLALCI